MMYNVIRDGQIVKHDVTLEQAQAYLKVYKPACTASGLDVVWHVVPEISIDTERFEKICGFVPSNPWQGEWWFNVDGILRAELGWWGAASSRIVERFPLAKSISVDIASCIVNPYA